MDYVAHALDAGTVGRLIACLREMDRTQQRTDEYGEREIAWYYTRDEVEDILGVPRGTLNVPVSEVDDESGAAASDLAPLTFRPTWVVAPGEILAEWMHENGQHPVVFAVQTDLGLGVVEQLLRGRHSLTTDIAERLASATGISVAFWLGAEANYRKALNDSAEPSTNDQ